MVSTLQEFIYSLPALQLDDTRVTVTGDCLERLDVFDGDILVFDLIHMPKPPQYHARNTDERKTDVCLCLYVDENGKISPMSVKAYDGRIFGKHSVSERRKFDPDVPAYKQQYKWFNSLAIFGVARECLTATGDLRWSKDTSDNPAQLPCADTVNYVNISPIEKQKRRNNHEC